MGTIGFPPAVAYAMTLRDAALVREGYETRQRGEWERALMMVNAWTGAGLKYEDLLRKREPLTKEKYEALKARLSHG